MIPYIFKKRLLGIKKIPLNITKRNNRKNTIRNQKDSFKHKKKIIEIIAFVRTAIVVAIIVVLLNIKTIETVAFVRTAIVVALFVVLYLYLCLVSISYYRTKIKRRLRNYFMFNPLFPTYIGYTWLQSIGVVFVHMYYFTVMGLAYYHRYETQIMQIRSSIFALGTSIFALGTKLNEYQLICWQDNNSWIFILFALLCATIFLEDIYIRVLKTSGLNFLIQILIVYSAILLGCFVIVEIATLLG